MTELGSGDFQYRELAEWGQLPDGWDLFEVVDVVVDRDDQVYVFNRGEHPLIVFSQDGDFIKSWGKEQFVRPHALTLVQEPDGSEALYCVDDDGHWVGKFTLDGELLMRIGERGKGAPPLSGQPFNRPTRIARDPNTGEHFISDGYSNARVHKFSADGQRLLFSWGDFGCESGQFNLPHTVHINDQGQLYVADRENHRVQIFDTEGNYLRQWNNMHRPCAFHLHNGLAYIGQLPTHLDVNADYPNVGACVTIHDLSGHCLARLGGAHPGEAPGEFTAPHGIAIDSRGDMYVGEVSWSAYGRRLNPPRTARCLRKLVKL
jgi:hypothetical protein